MMKHLCLLCIILLCGCNWGVNTAGNITVNLPAANLLKAGNVAKLVVQNHKNLEGTEGDLELFKQYLRGLNNNDAASIPYAMDYIRTCLPPDMPQRDRVIVLFNLKFLTVLNNINNVLPTKYESVTKLYDADSKSLKLKAFRDNLAACGIGIFQTEGNDYLDVLPNYFYNDFKDRVSAGVKEYLSIRRVELAEGFSEDAGLLISYQQLYQRVKRWERFLHDYPATVYTTQAENYYKMYLGTLLTGMDNSPVFTDGYSLSAEVKNIYEQAMNDDPASRTAKIITPYYTMLMHYGFGMNDSVSVFLKERHLIDMRGVQPDTR